MRTIIHIGMPRAASTFLQREFFPKIEGFRFYGVAESQYSATFQKILYQDESNYNEPEIKAALAHMNDQNSILSNELFIGQTLYLNATNRTRTALRLKAIFPEAEIILVLRNQLSLLQSLYALGVYAGSTASPEEFLRFSDSAVSIHQPLYPSFEPAESTEPFLYSSLIALYKGQFKKVHLVLFEDFKSNQERFLKLLSDSLGFHAPGMAFNDQKVNRSLSARQLRLIKILNKWKRLLPTSIYSVKLRFIEHRMNGSKSFGFDTMLTEKIKVYYKEDNHRVFMEHPELKSTQAEKDYFI